MKDARCFQPSPATTTAAAAYGTFNAGQAAMIVVSSVDAVTNVQQPNLSLNVGRFPLPGGTARSTRVLQSVDVATAEDSISSLDLAKGYTPEAWSLFAPFVKAHETAVAPISWANNANGPAAFRAGITALLAGTKSADQVLSDADAAW